MKNLVRDITALGGSFFYFLLVVVFLILEKWDIAFHLFIGYILIHAVIIPMRIIFFRERPHPRPTDTLIKKIDAASFPSLHAARASYMGTFFISSWGWDIMSGLVLVITGLVLLSRHYLQEHRIGDIIAGMIIGLGFAFLVHYIT